MIGRTYDDPCGVARALDAVGERWALLVVRELLLGPRRFSELRRSLVGASQNVLSHRLRELEQAGVVARRRLGPPASVWAYQLTPRGAELEPVLFALAKWGSRLPLRTEADLSTDALVLAMRTTFDPPAAGRALTIELRLGDDQLVAEIADGRLTVRRGTHVDEADAVIETSASTLRSLIFGERTLADVDAGHGDLSQRDVDAGHRDLNLREVDGGDVGVVVAHDVNAVNVDGVSQGIDAAVVVRGDRKAAERFLGLFPRPATS